MKRKAWAYVLAGVVAGMLIGGAVSSWAFGQVARVANGKYQVGMYYENENLVRIQVYSPKKVKSVYKEGTYNVTLELQ